MLAQRYPEAYDGIAAAAPAFNWNQFIPAAAWAQVMMSIMRQFPTKCELDSLTEAAVASCDALDGVTDGLISDVDKCSFNPFTMIGSVRNCTSTGKSVTITEAPAPANASEPKIRSSCPRTSSGEGSASTENLDPRTLNLNPEPHCARAQRVRVVLSPLHSPELTPWPPTRTATIAGGLRPSPQEVNES